MAAVPSAEELPVTSFLPKLVVGGREGGDTPDGAGNRGGGPPAIHFANHVLATAVRVGGVGVFEWDPAGRRMRWNEVVAGILGLPTAVEASWERWIGAVHRDDRAHARRAARDVYADGEARYRIVRPDGSVRHVLVRGEEFRHGDRTIVVGVAIDVTEATATQDNMARILDAMRDGYLALDAEWRIAAVNAPGERLLRQPADGLVGRVCWDAFPAVRGTAFEVTARRVVATGQPTVFEELYGPNNMWFEVRMHPAGGGGLVAYFRDITGRRAREAERERLLAAERAARKAAEAAHAAMAQRATHDALTGLYNRPEAMRRIDAALATGRRVALLFIDLDRFKLVNDSLGHSTGDMLLRTIAGRLRETVGDGGTVARLGGDEFIIALESERHGEVDRLAAVVCDALRKPVNLGGLRLVTSASIGLAAAGAPATAGALLRDADAALHRAKATGRDRAVWFDTALHHAAIERLNLEHDLREAVGHDDLTVAYQPVFDLVRGDAVGVEVLARWHHPTRGEVPPGVFIPVAEESGIIVPLGARVTELGMCGGARLAADTGRTTWINLSPRQFTRPGLADMIEGQLRASGLDPHHLGLEITESAFAEADAVHPELWRLRDLGVRLAIDDFGTGHSSIARLRDLPIDVLKIDRAFVRGSVTVAGAATMSAIAELGHALGMKLIAEGIETAEQLRHVRAAGCDMASGFLLSPPVPLEDVEAASAAGARTLAARP